MHVHVHLCSPKMQTTLSGPPTSLLSPCVCPCAFRPLSRSLLLFLLHVLLFKNLGRSCTQCWAVTYQEHGCSLVSNTIRHRDLEPASTPASQKFGLVMKPTRFGLVTVHDKPFIVHPELPIHLDLDSSASQTSSMSRISLAGGLP